MNRLIRYYIKFLHYSNKNNNLFIKFKDKNKMFLFKHDIDEFNSSKVLSLFLQNKTIYKIYFRENVTHFHYVEYDNSNIEAILEKHGDIHFILKKHNVIGDPRLDILDFKLEDFDEGDITKEVMLYGKSYLEAFKIHLPQEFCDLMDSVLDNPNIENHFMYQDDELYFLD